MQGASAIGEEIQKYPARVLVVWEPVLDTDREPPSESARSRVKAVHFWDPSKAVSESAKPRLQSAMDGFVGKQGLVTDDVVWDWVGVYPPGVRWEKDFPIPSSSAAPVVHHLKALLR